LLHAAQNRTIPRYSKTLVFPPALITVLSRKFSITRPPPMLAKLCFLTLSIGVIGATLLSLRQQRGEAIHAMATLQRDLPLLDRRLAFAQTQVAARITPSFVHTMAVALGNLTPVGVDPLSRNPVTPAVAGTTSAKRTGASEIANIRPGTRTDDRTEPGSDSPSTPPRPTPPQR